MSRCPLKLASAALNTTPLDWEGNLAQALCALDAARASGARIACLPELALSGAGCEDAFFSPFVAETALEMLQVLLPKTRDLVVAVGLPLAVGAQLFNAAALIEDGVLLGFAAKRRFASDRLSYESRWFTPWAEHCPRTLEIGGKTLPLGEAVFEVNGLRIALCIGSDLSDIPRDVEVILNPNARGFAFGEQERFEQRLIALTREAPCAIASSNLVGNEAGTVIYGGGALIVQAGHVLARSPRFSFKSATLAIGDLAHSSATPATSWGADPLASKEEAFAHAVALGLFDYLRKSGMSSFVLSLSGGADSASIAVLVMLMARFALRELGAAAFVEALGLPSGLLAARRFDVTDGDQALEAAVCEVMPHLLTTAYQGTRNSSQTTRAAARAIAKAVGCRHLELDIEPLVAGYRTAVEAALGRTFDWQHDDTVLQNIQARVRGPSIWMIANAQNALLLATSNRSEVAVGYATMDGDTCGGLAPIAGIDKAWLRHWLDWIEREGPKGGCPVPALALVNAQAPTAELRPAQAQQTDEGDLMPYAILDEIERSAIHQRRAPTATFHALRARHPEIAPDVLAGFVSRFYRLFARSQWKRARGAPSFHLDDANLSPGSWCRFPLLSSGFERELAALQAQAKLATEA